MGAGILSPPAGELEVEMVGAESYMWPVARAGASPRGGRRRD
jgi:hypothetical protein